MRLLLDTNVLIWWVNSKRRFPAAAEAILTDPASQLLVSPVSAWEIALKRRLGKLDFDGAFLQNFDASVRNLGFETIGITSQHMVRGAELKAEHKDPFDRMLAGQALVEGLAVVTADPAFQTLGAKVVW
jgi:PIN domain nuclease of toxin-antitoxin system